MIEEEKVKWRSLKKYPCKKGKGEHEYLQAQIKHNMVRYIYRTKNGVCDSGEIIKKDDYKYLRTELHIMTETFCKNCGHKSISFLSDNLK